MDETKLEKYELNEPRYVQAIQVGNNITDIFKLSCCNFVEKDVVKGIVFGIGNERAVVGDWILLDEKGEFSVVPDIIFNKKYKKIEK
jgi:hypothetical protein